MASRTQNKHIIAEYMGRLYNLEKYRGNARIWTRIPEPGFSKSTTKRYRTRWCKVVSLEEVIYPIIYIFYALDAHDHPMVIKDFRSDMLTIECYDRSYADDNDYIERHDLQGIFIARKPISEFKDFLLEVNRNGIWKKFSLTSDSFKRYWEEYVTDLE